MSSFTTTTSSAFTLSHAKRIVSKVATDLHRFHRFYSRPSTTHIAELEKELTELMQCDGIDEVTYGFQKYGEWVTAVKYKSVNGILISDDGPGGLRAGFDVSGAGFSSFLSHSTAWYLLDKTTRDRIETRIPFSRNVADEPSVKDGYWCQDRGYSAGGRALERSSIRQY